MAWQHAFREGVNCWRVAEADQVACLVDGENYFRAFKQAALSAQRSILIVGWDVNSRIALEYPDHAMAGIPNQLGPFSRLSSQTEPGAAHPRAELGFALALQA